MVPRLCVSLALVPLLVPSGICLCHIFEAGPGHAHHHQPLHPHHDPADHAPGCPAAKPPFLHRPGDAPLPLSTESLVGLLLPEALTLTGADTPRMVDTLPVPVFSDLPRYLILRVLRN